MLRKKLSLLIANCFRLHLKEELKKKDSLLNHITLEGIPFRSLTANMIKDLETDFPELNTLPDPEFNLFRKWNAIWRGKESAVLEYSESTYKIYNQLYYIRLLDLRDGTEESRSRLKTTVKNQLSKTSFFGQKVTFGRFFQGESNMRETIRNALLFQMDIPVEEAYRMILEQSDFILECSYSYFDEIIQEAYAKSDSLLKNILPDSAAEELKATGRASPIHVDSASVMFTDFSGFTAISSAMNPADLIEELDICFSAFDLITEKYGLERIKTIGDSYLCVGGLFESSPHIENSCSAALEILQFMKERKEKKESEEGRAYWNIRIGLHTGPLAAGVIGKKKFAFDIWGDTVNTASRMESAGEPGMINVSEQIYSAAKDFFSFSYRGEMEVKGKGRMKMYSLESDI
ncbi:MAG TPA: adenylate/guanylate cyclase domain-containing protein [Leptospiraceae bacterium]|nr:adenylate/guanylate cyclase domain-containing protein [Leptospiraceae bacterium]